MARILELNLDQQNVQTTMMGDDDPQYCCCCAFIAKTYTLCKKTNRLILDMKHVKIF